MIYESSKDYLSGKVILIFDGAQPSVEDINAYCCRNYGFIPKSINVMPESPGPFGYINPGRVYCHSNSNYFE